jgi:hypothetical protein
VATHALSSLAIDACPTADVIDVQALPVPAGLSGAEYADPACWLQQLFDRRSVNPVVGALFVVRGALVRLIGVDRSAEPDLATVFDVQLVEGEEALTSQRARHLDFWCAVGIDGDRLRVTTVVRFHGWRGRLYWLPVGALHGPVTRSMMRRTIARASRAHH